MHLIKRRFWRIMVFPFAILRKNFGQNSLYLNIRETKKVVIIIFANHFKTNQREAKFLLFKVQMDQFGSTCKGCLHR